MTQIKDYRLRIKDRDEQDRPREKMILNGKRSLSNSELLAILIGSGNRNESALELAQRILKHFDNQLEALAHTEIDYLTQHFTGIGEAKAITILAAMEISARLSFSQKDAIAINNSKSAYQLMEKHLLGCNAEEVWVIFVNKANDVIKTKRISIGGLSCCIVDIKIIIKEAINLLASGIILVHNHPSGRRLPSTEDKQVTQKLKEACQFCEIQLLDHIIFCNDSYYSFADENTL